MKNILFLALTLLLGLTACRKKIELDISVQETSFDVKCFNGVIDDEEWGIDCGPNCEPCEQYTPACDLTDSLFSFSSLEFTVTDAEIDTLQSEFKVTFNFGMEGYVMFNFYEFPDLDKEYYGTQYETSIDEENCQVKLDHNSISSTYHSFSRIYMIRDESYMTFMACESNWNNSGIGSSVPCEFKLTVGL
ncbi:MAG: hypothetical protein ACI857_003145 [Arenicella sp.]|jgi:hypothetical protein